MDIRNYDHVPSQSDETNNRMGTHWQGQLSNQTLVFQNLWEHVRKFQLSGWIKEYDPKNVSWKISTFL
jgi:hypothetical protein